ncbi:MT-A70-domain-containing protein [Choiromyces venosus 120613-1]|uniref:MT-A70-domain-containing protein n=1 Tax=Choiromyces venosus 120613-1 TaxID=1336337 RepID=A0A3N4KEA1_9PEZI|nr:MT-A70-domain-containing protein [Choiromyces venosus 120613-1]
MSSSILYQSPSGHIVLLDIPSSISSPPGLRLCSSSPPETQYVLPEPKDNSSNQSSIESSDEIRTSVLEALEHVRNNYCGSFLLPRITLEAGVEITGELDFHESVLLLQNPDEFSSPEFLNLTPEQEPAIENVDDISDIYSAPVFSTSGAWRTLTILHPTPQKHFHVPPNSSFLLSDFRTSISAFTAISTRLRRFHLVLLDPPWPNKSATRNKTYTTMRRFDIQQLQCIPLSQALIPADPASGIKGGLVGIWITNKPKFRAFVLEKMFPQWGIEFVGEWVWVKITSSGEPIFDMGSRMRRPYEVLMFGRTRGNVGKGGVDRHVTKKRRVEEGEVGAGSGAGIGDAVQTFPRKTILAVPDLHSRKPCIKELIEPYLPLEYNACEIFGRNLTEGWVTWGDEAIKYNWSGYWS